MHLDGCRGTRHDSGVDVLRAGGGDGLHPPVDGEGIRRGHAFKRASGLAGHGHGAPVAIIGIGDIERGLHGRGSARTKSPARVVHIVRDHETRRRLFAEKTDLGGDIQHLDVIRRLLGEEELVALGIHELAPLLIVAGGAGCKTVRVPGKTGRELARVVERRSSRALAACTVADAKVDAVIAVRFGREAAGRHLAEGGVVDHCNFVAVEIGDSDQAVVIVVLHEVIGDAALHEHQTLVGVCLVVAHRICRTFVGVAGGVGRGQERTGHDNAAVAWIVSCIERPGQGLLIEPWIRERNCRGHCRESPNNPIHEFLHLVTPFHFIAPLVQSKPCPSPMSKVQARQLSFIHPWYMDINVLSDY